MVCETGSLAEEVSCLLQPLADALPDGAAVDPGIAPPGELVECEGDLLEADEQYVVHQTNCTSHGGGFGLAREIFQRWPAANCYSDGTRRAPGRVDVRPGCRLEGRGGVINLFGQRHYGMPNGRETALQRRVFFQQGLDALLDQVAGLESLAFPAEVGCGLAGGHWPAYLEMLRAFAARAAKRGVQRVVVYRLPMRRAADWGRVLARQRVNRRQAGRYLRTHPSAATAATAADAEEADGDTPRRQCAGTA